MSALVLQTAVPLFTAATPVFAEATNLNQAQPAASKAHTDQLGNEGKQPTATGQKIAVSSKVLDDAIAANKGKIDLVAGTPKVHPVLKASDKAGIAKTIADITADYQRQADEINRLASQAAPSAAQPTQTAPTNQALATEINQLNTSLRKAIDDARKAGVAVNISNAPKVVNTVDDAKAHHGNMTNKLNTAARDIATAAGTSTTQYATAKKAHDDATARNKTLKDAYDKKMTDYNKVLGDYNTKLAAYNNALNQAKANTTKPGQPKRALTQALNIHQSEDGAVVKAIGSTPSSTIRKGEPWLEGYNRILGSTNFLVYDNFRTNQTINLEYTNIQRATFAGKKIVSVNYEITNLNSGTTGWNGPGSVRLVIPNDPTEGFIAWRDNGNGNWTQDRIEFRVKARYKLDDGSWATFSKERPAVFTHASLNHNHIGLEYVKDTSGSFVELNGSTVTVQGNMAHSQSDNANIGVEWDTSTSPNAYMGAVLSEVTAGDSYTVTYGQGDMPSNPNGGQTYWFQINSQPLADTVPWPGDKPTPPNPPNYETVPPLPSPPGKPELTVTVDLLAAEPAPNTPADPTKPQFTYTHHDFRVVTDATKSVVNADNVDINGQQIVKGSLAKWINTIPNLPANRELTDTIEITDPLRAGYVYDDAATKADPSNANWTITYDAASHTVKAAAKAALVDKLNKDLTKDVAVDTFTIHGVPTNDAALYENVYSVLHKTKPKNDEPGIPTTFTYTNKVRISTPKPPKPSKQVLNLQGDDINNGKTTTGQTIKYRLSWNQSVYRDVKLSKEQILAGVSYIEDFDETAVSVDPAQVVVKDGDTVIPGITVKKYESLAEAPSEVQAEIKSANVQPKGAFLHLSVDNDEDFLTKYAKQGKDLHIELHAKVIKNIPAVYENTGWQIDFGNGYMTNVVNNHIVKPQPTKQVTADGKDINLKTVKNGQAITYNLGWDLSVYEGINHNAQSIAGGFYYLDDYDETKVTPNLEIANIKLENGQAIPKDLYEFVNYASLDAAPQPVKALFNQRGIKPNGAFVFVNIQNPQAFYDNYVRTGTDLILDLPMTVKDGVAGSFKNIGHQIDFAGDVDSPHVPTNEVENHIPKHEAVKYFQPLEKADINGAKAVDGELPARNLKYSWLLENRLDEYSVKHKLYKEINFVDKSFADIQQLDHVLVTDSKGKSINDNVSVIVLQNGNLFSIDGKEASQEQKDAYKAGKLEFNLDLNEGELPIESRANTDKNVLLPTGLDKDGKKASVTIKAIVRNPQLIDDTTYFVALNGVSISGASKDELKHYDQGARYVIDNISNLETGFEEDVPPTPTDDAKATHTSPKDTPQFENTGASSGVAIAGVISTLSVGLLGVINRDKLKRLFKK